MTKKECVGHVQKRVGNQLRMLKITTGKTKLEDGKSLGGKGRLTRREIDKLQIYQSKRNVNEKEKKIRQARRVKKLGEEDRNRETVGNVYEYGGF